MTTLQHILSSIEDESTFGYNELRLSREEIDSLPEEENALIKNTVELFCFGDYTYYRENSDSFLELSDKALRKLKQLSLASEALKSNRLQYSYLQQSLDFPSKIELEIFLAESITSKVIDATLLGHEEIVKVKSSRGRDVLLDDEPERDELSKRYGAKSVNDLVVELKKFSVKIDNAYDYILQLSGEATTSTACGKEEASGPEPPSTTTTQPNNKVTTQLEQVTPGESQSASGGEEDEVSDLPEDEIARGNDDVKEGSIEEESTLLKKAPSKEDHEANDTVKDEETTDESTKEMAGAEDGDNGNADDDDDPPSRKRKID